MECTLPDQFASGRFGRGFPATFILPYPLPFLGKNRRTIKSKKGTPTNMIQGTKVSVSMQVLWYNGNTDNACPNR